MKKVLASIVVAAVLAVPAVALAHHNDDAPGTDGPNGRTLYVGTQHEDDLRGGNAPDLIRALGGDDRLGGEHGSDVLVAGGGDDVLWPGRGKDVNRCGSGFDVVYVRLDHRDSFEDCERIKS